MEELKQAFYEVMYKYQKRFGEAGVMANLNTWAQRKATLLTLLRRHPNWVEAEKAIVFRFSEGRDIERDVVDEIAFTMLDIARETVAPEGYPAFSDAFRAVVSEYNTTLSVATLEIVRSRGGIKCATGQKASRIIGKLCRQFGVDGHKRYNAVFAQIADALNPLQIHRTAILSVHPCDFLEMSNRDNTWHSCHGLDKGRYQMGALSYMLDEVSMIFYTVDNDVTDHFYRLPRRSRQMYFFRENMLFQSRMYPNDASDLMDQYRNIVQKAIAYCLGVPNLWTLKKERDDISPHCESASGSMQYPDYDYYGNISVLKDTELNGVFLIGAPPICVSCGRKISSRESRLKCGCADTVVCKVCGETVPIENTHYVEGTFQCKKCLHICAVCGRPSRGEMFAAFDRRGQLVQVCTECHAISLSPLWKVQCAACVQDHRQNLMPPGSGCGHDGRCGMIDFETVLRLHQPELKKALREELSEMGFVPISRKGFLYAPGEIPVLLVAHLDTVHPEPPEIICYSKDGRYMMSPQGIGGDDRAGVYMILQILRQVNCHVLFCEDEECGGRGASSFTKSGILPDVNYIVELDRKGENDAVYYGCDNPKFRKYVAEFGFQETFGSFSDISILAPHLKTAAVNLSTGYYNAHRNHELIDTQVMSANTERVIEMVMTPAEHYPYRTKPATQPKFTLGKSLFDHELTDLIGDTESQKLLMPLPEDARLMADGIEVPSTKNYMIDRNGTVYAYIDALDAALESEMLIACTADGQEVCFMQSGAKYIRITSYEEAISLFNVHEMN